MRTIFVTVLALSATFVAEGVKKRGLEKSFFRYGYDKAFPLGSLIDLGDLHGIELQLYGAQEQHFPITYGYDSLLGPASEILLKNLLPKYQSTITNLPQHYIANYGTPHYINNHVFRETGGHHGASLGLGAGYATGIQHASIHLNNFIGNDLALTLSLPQEPATNIPAYPLPKSQAPPSPTVSTYAISRGKEAAPVNEPMIEPPEPQVGVTIGASAPVLSPATPSQPAQTQPTVGTLGSGSLGYTSLGNGVYALGSGSLGYSGPVPVNSGVTTNEITGTFRGTNIQNLFAPRKYTNALIYGPNSYSAGFGFLDYNALTK